LRIEFNCPALPLAIAASILLAPGLSIWASEETAEESVDLDPVVVVASRIPRPLSQIAAQVTVIDSRDLSAGMVENLDTLLRHEPGIDLQSTGTRFGGDSINIRGIGGNRVDVHVDGVPLADGFAIGAYSDAGRTLVETDRLKRVEVLHGPASVMHGSNALGGVVSFVTWDPADRVEAADGGVSLSARLGYQGVDDSRVGSALGAWSDGRHGLLLAATYREGHETERQDVADGVTDPQDWSSRDFMLRYTLDTAGGNLWRVTAAKARRDVFTDVRSLLGYGRRFRSTTLLQGDDRDQNQRLSLDYVFTAGGWENGLLRLYRAESETDQRTHELRENTPRPVRIDRRFLYEQSLGGVEGSVFRSIEVGATRHRVGVGAEWKSSDIESLRDGLSTNLLTGDATDVILGESMPVRDFPNSTREEFAVWAQDEIRFAGGRWELVPAIRWDRYDLTPKPDDIWREDNPGTPVVGIEESRATPRLGLLFHPSEQWSLYGQYSEGFRAPPPSDANIGFQIPLFGFKAIPNPDLKSETSSGLEIGLRRQGIASRFSLASFRTDYDDFIESRALIGIDPGSGYLVFQSRNIEQARIRGIDLRFQQDLSAWNERLSGLNWSLAGFWAEGEDRQADQPLNSIAPPQLVNRLDWNSADATWRMSVFWTLTARKSRSDIDEQDENLFATPSWQTVDLTAAWRPSPRVEMRAGVFNLFDETYWRWLDVYRLAEDDPMIPLMARPGRNYTVSLQLNF
jgi:hemoglobin/transferrin/lactoferrin receptor protein